MLSFFFSFFSCQNLEIIILLEFIIIKFFPLNLVSSFQNEMAGEINDVFIIIFSSSIYFSFGHTQSYLSKYLTTTVVVFSFFSGLISFRGF